ncbi:MAG: VirB3 family type IV secretion system protein [Gammaproteobacteria bacterium]|nr:VirB3 family type IV secretion system protein [Gammaproteobacteria bacterium]
MSTPGYQIAIHSSLTTPLLMAGAPRTFSLLNGTFAAAATLGLHSFYAIPICAVIQIVMAALTKKDAYCGQVIMRHIKQKNYYGI